MKKIHIKPREKPNKLTFHIKKVYSVFIIAPAILFLNGGMAYVGLMNFLLLIPFFTLPIVLTICTIMAAANAVIFYYFDLNVIKDGMSVNSKKSAVECLKYDAEEIECTKAIYMAMHEISNNKELSDTELNKYNFIRAQLNKNMQDKKIFFIQGEKVNKKKVWSLRALTAVGLSLSGAGGYFAITSFLATLGLAGPVDWFIIVIVIIAVLTGYLSLQVKGIRSAIFPTVLKYKEITEKMNDFEIYSKPLKNNYTIISAQEAKIIALSEEGIMKDNKIKKQDTYIKSLLNKLKVDE